MNLFKHLRKKRTKLVAATTLFLIALGLAFFRWQMGNEAQNLNKKIESIFSECSTRSQTSFDYGCLREKMTPIVSAFWVGETVSSLEEIFSSGKITLEEYGSFTCHAAGHIVGELAVNSGADFISVAADCGSGCDHGCAHGAFVAELRGRDDFLGNVDSFCAKYESSDIRRELVSCSHIVGHGLGELLLGDSVKALGYCDKIREDDARHSCGQGVIMEHFLGLPNSPKGSTFSMGEVVEFCANLPRSYKEECYNNLGFYSSRASKDEIDALTICDQVPGPSKAPCVSSLGSAVYFLYRNSPSEMASYCGNFDEPLRASCIQGAIETAVGEEDAFSYGRFLCGERLGDLRRECFSFLGNRLEWARGVSYREKSCGQLAEEDIRFCLGNYFQL